MNVTDLEYFRNLLIAREQGLTELLRPSALPSEDNDAKVRSLLADIKDALGRVEDGTYGTCEVCCGEVEHERLVTHPTTCVCLDCMSNDEKAQLEEELSIAREIHRALLPAEVPHVEGFQVVVKAQPSNMVGGDYYDFLNCPAGDRMRIIVGDSMGKGIPAGLLMSNLQGALRVLSDTTESPELLMATLNRWICHNVPLTKFISLICLELPSEPEPGTDVFYTNAGHPPPILVRNGGTVERLETAGIVLGVDNSGTYKSHAVHVHPGDLLLLYTDGVTEALNGSGEMYDEERLARFVQLHRLQDLNTLVEDLVSDIRRFTGHRELDDDFTLVAIRRGNT